MAPEPVPAQAVPELIDVPEPRPASAILSPPQEQPAEPILSVEERIAAAARASVGGSPAPAGPAYSQEILAQIALNDPERYETLKEEGYSLEKLPWGPNR